MVRLPPSPLAARHRHTGAFGLDVRIAPLGRGGGGGQGGGGVPTTGVEPSPMEAMATPMERMPNQDQQP